MRVCSAATIAGVDAAADGAARGPAGGAGAAARRGPRAGAAWCGWRRRACGRARQARVQAAPRRLTPRTAVSLPPSTWPARAPTRQRLRPEYPAAAYAALCRKIGPACRLAMCCSFRRFVTTCHGACHRDIRRRVGAASSPAFPVESQLGRACFAAPSLP